MSLTEKLEKLNIEIKETKKIIDNLKYKMSKKIYDYDIIKIKKGDILIINYKNKECEIQFLIPLLKEDMDVFRFEDKNNEIICYDFFSKNELKNRLNALIKKGAKIEFKEKK